MPTLNDARVFTRTISFAQLVPAGIMVGAVVDLVRSEPSSSWYPLALFLGLALQLVVNITVLIVVRRADTRVKAHLEESTRELATGTAPLTAPVPARVVRSRKAAGRAGAVVDLFGRPQGRLEPSARIVVLAVLPSDEPPRRVALLAPVGPAASLTRQSIHLVHLHPSEREAAVLNVRAEPGRLEAAQHDPRWGTSRLPSDRSVSGGLLIALAYGLLGAVVGIGVGLALAAFG